MRRVFRGLSVLGLEILLLVSLLPTTAEAFPISIFNFQLGAIGVYPSGGNSSWFAQAAWTPTINLAIIGLRGELGFTAPQDAAGNRFLATNLEVLGQLTLLPFITLEGGGGVHTWSGNGGTNPAISGGVAIGLAGIDRLYATYTHLFLGSGVNEFKAGIGIKL